MMTHDQARIVVTLLLRQGRELDAMLAQLDGMGLAGDEFNMLRRHVGNLMGGMLLDIMNPIFDIHPDLKPPELA
jgi:hypothetical protein